MRRLLRRWLVPAGALLAVVLAALLIVVAIDVLRVGGSVESDDVRFQTRQTITDGLWADAGFLPGGVARRATGLDDDLRYRRAVWLYARVQPGKVIVQGPVLEGLRGSAQTTLTDAARREQDPVRRAQLLNLIALITLDRYAGDPANRLAIIRDAVGTLQNAIAVDPGNADAKFNLELVLRDFEAPNASGEQTDRGAAQGRQGAAARAGSGY
jgi:hypothetical protein